MINALQKIIKYSAYILLLLSALFFLLSLYDFYNAPIRFSVYQLYFFIAKYSGAHKFTFVVLAAYLALEQLKLAQANNKKSLEQLKFTQEDITIKRENEIKNDTLKHATYYLTEMQVSYRELTDKGALTGLYIDYKVQDLGDWDALQKNEHLFKIVQNNISIHHKDIVMVLNKFEAFAACFNLGNLDINLGNNIVGKTYCAQVGLLNPFLAYYRNESSPTFGENIIKLCQMWNIQ